VPAVAPESARRYQRDVGEKFTTSWPLRQTLRRVRGLITRRPADCSHQKRPNPEIVTPLRVYADDVMAPKHALTTDRAAYREMPALRAT
jgi:hypothetical protein